jgi:hypothetical protein
MKELLFNPFKRIAGVQALMAGLGILLISALLASFFGLRYDGAIDAHFVASGLKVSFLTSVAEQLVNVLCISLFLFIAAFVAGARNTRPIDMLGTISMARFPYMFLPLLNIGGFFSGLSESMLNISSEDDALLVLQDTNTIWLIILSIPLIALVVWAIALFLYAYKVSANLKGSKMVVSFIVGLLVAEIVSILIIRSFL